MNDDYEGRQRSGGGKAKDSARARAHEGRGTSASLLGDLFLRKDLCTRFEFSRLQTRPRATTPPHVSLCLASARHSRRFEIEALGHVLDETRKTKNNQPPGNNNKAGGGKQTCHAGNLGDPCDDGADCTTWGCLEGECVGGQNIICFFFVEFYEYLVHDMPFNI